MAQGDVARRFLAVTPSDTVALSKGAADAFYVGGAGSIVIEGDDGDAVAFSATAGIIIPASGLRVHATGTTATGIVALYL